MSSESQFAGKVALVTGAASGMGAATAELLAQRGASVVLVDRQEALLREVAARIVGTGAAALAWPADVTDPAAVQDAITAGMNEFGALHVAMNNAGIASQNDDVPDLPIEVWDETIQTNLSAMFYCLRAELPAIEAAGGGAVVNVSSVFGDRGLPMRTAYSASKHGIRGLTRAAARDWAARGIRINELQPGVIDTPMTRDQGEPGEVEAIARIIPLQRVGEPNEIATAVAFLLSDDASYITGAHLAVDGGFLT